MHVVENYYKMAKFAIPQCRRTVTASKKTKTGQGVELHWKFHSNMAFVSEKDINLKKNSENSSLFLFDS